MKIEISNKITPREAIKLQKKLAPLVSEQSELPNKISNLVGCDATYFQGTTLAASTLVNFEELKLVDVRTVKERTRFPYIPGLFAFREAPPILRAIRGLKPKSYVCMVDAHGRAHPRKFGLACFVGLVLDQPTIGVAKNFLYGCLRKDVVVDENEHPLATVVKLPQSMKTIYVSVGHKISLEDAVEIVKYSLTPQGPIPIRLAHEEVTKRKWLLKKSNPTS